MSGKSGSSGHFWPAYVDMMTVLLMIFLFLTLIFQIILATAKKEDVRLNKAQNMSMAYSSEQSSYIINIPPGTALLDDKMLSSVESWIIKNKKLINEKGIEINAWVSVKNNDAGIRLSKQFSRILQLKNSFSEISISQDKVTYRNRIVESDGSEHDIELIELSVQK